MVANETDSASEPFRPEDWISAAETIRRVRAATISFTAHIAIAKRAHAGLLRARAELLVINDTQRHRDVDVAPRFWWAEGHEALEQNWEVGDFETWIDQKIKFQVFGVRFHRDDLRLMTPTAFSEEPAPASIARESGGRPMSALWPGWVAELAAVLHEEGVPPGAAASGADELIGRIADRLAARGMEGPTRSTVQETVKAVLRRMREAEN